MTDTLAVTGASRGLGRFVAEKAIAAGWRVIGLSRTIEALPGGEMMACDVGDPEAVKTVFNRLRREETLYGLINAAGIASMNLSMSTPPEAMMRLVRTNLLGTMYCSVEAGKCLVRRRRGRIINVSSIAVALAIKGEAIYVASKAGVEGFSRAYAREMADHGVTVNVIAPGPIDTALIAKIDPVKIDEIIARQIIPRKGMPEDVWNVVELLLSPAASMLTGQILHVGGA